MIIRKNINTGETKEYSSKSQAARELGLDESTVRKAIKFNKTVKGVYKFSRTEESSISAVTTRKSPKILMLDIETSLLLAQVFQKQVWKARIGHNQLVSDYYILTWSAKWLGEDKMYSDRLTAEEVYNENDGRIVANLWNLLDEADIVCGHNSEAFDIPNIFTRCVQHNFPPPSSFRQIDTLRIAQKNFGFTHNSLDALAQFFGIEGKISTTIELWKSCIRGDEKALEQMETYNQKDVRILEQIYYRLRPYAKGLPNLDLYTDDDKVHCPTCGCATLVPIEGKYFFTQAVKYGTLRCTSCGAIARNKKGEGFINKKQISAIPR